MTLTTALLYVRTPMGRSAAFSADTTLGDQLKAVLKAVDGKTSVSALMVQFADHDAADLLGQLESAGLIKLRENRINNFQRKDLNPDSADLSEFKEAAPAAQQLFAAAIQPLAVTQTLADTPTLPATGLAKIVDVMSTFVLTYLPQQAFTVLTKLEGFQSLDQLEAELPDYAVLAKTSGSVGLLHLADVTERMREAAAV